MVLPYQSTSIQDPGLQKTEPAVSQPAIFGVGSGGTGSANTVYSYSSAADVIAGHGYGPGPEAACEHLVRCGGVVRYVELGQDSDGALGSVTGGSAGGTIGDNSSTPYNWYEVRIKIVLGGAVGTATFRYSLDGGRNYSDVYTSAATFDIPNSGVSITMAATTGFVADDVYEADATGPTYTSTEMDAAFTALKACPLNWDYGILAGRHADASTAQTIFNALEADRTGMGEPHQYKPWIMDAGGDTAATTGATFTATSKWILVAYGTADMATQTPVAGYKSPALPIYMFAIQKAGNADLSEHWGRKASGQLPGIEAWTTEFDSPLSHDEKQQNNLDELGFMTVGHYPGDRAGEYYIMRGRIKAPAGSDFRQWQFSRLWSATYRVVWTAQNQMQNKSWATKSDDTLVEAEAKAAEELVEKQMKAILHVPNVEGTNGHVSINGPDKGFYYRLSRTEPTGSTDMIRSFWGIKPRGYGEYIETEGGFVAQTVQ